VGTDMINQKIANNVIEFSRKPDLYILTVHMDNLCNQQFIDKNGNELKGHYTNEELQMSLYNCVNNQKGDIIQAMRGWITYFKPSTLQAFYDIRFYVDKRKAS
jgi:hypothetical protein